jgi:hypothetical protein
MTRALDAHRPPRCMARVVRRAGAMALLLVLALPRGARAGTADAGDPIPVLGGQRILSPGPRGLGYAGLAADPSSIGNFQGVVTLAYLRGKARDAAGRRWTMENDIRVFQGEYVSADGMHRQGTFAFL